MSSSINWQYFRAVQSCISSRVGLSPSQTCQLPNPVLSIDKNYEASILSFLPHILAAFRGVDAFRSAADHIAIVHEVRCELKTRKTKSNDAELMAIVNKLSCNDCGSNNCVWPRRCHHQLSMELTSAQEFWDSILLRYARTPVDLPTHCDGCDDQMFTVCHTLECKKGYYLVVLWHNEIQDEHIDLASKALTPSAVHNAPRIHTTATTENHRPASSDSQSLQVQRRRERQCCGLRPLATRDWRHHGCAYHWSGCQVEYLLSANEGSHCSQAWEKAQVVGALSWTAPPLLSICCLHWWSHWKRSANHDEKAVSQTYWEDRQALFSGTMRVSQC